MKRVSGRRFVRAFVVLDNTRFTGCTFIECRLKFSGGESSFSDCTFVRPEIEFDGRAANTVALLSALGMLNDQKVTTRFG
jgi:hypothetical protein